VATALIEIDRESLWESSRGDELVLVDALSPISYAAGTCPG